MEMILVGDFLRTWNRDVSTYLLDMEFTTIEEAAKHAEGYAVRQNKTNNTVSPNNPCIF